ncbi:MAG: hypothetical protein AB8B89_08120 [Gammaproteobacteria bacterium]
MCKAKFVFHGIFSDVVDSSNTSKQITRVLFDVEFKKQFHSHLMADVELIKEDGEFEVRSQLPFTCKQFAAAAIQYYQYALGPQAAKISHSGPKGASIATNNVIRAQWHTELEAED